MKQAPKTFIQAFRRRSLLVSFLSLSFLAALANEGIRWLMILLNRWLGYDLPVFSIGPFFLVMAFLYTLRRWSLTAAAERADRALDFRDRLTSFVDIEGRRDVPAPIVRAQTEETAGALTGISLSRARPVPVLLCAGPLVLALSVFYPNLMKLAPPGLQVTQHTNDVRHDPADPEGPDSSGELSEPDLDSQPAPEDEVPETPPEEDAARPEGDDTPSLAGPPLGTPGGATPEDRSRPHSVPEQPSGLESTRTGEELSRVVDPLFSPREEDLPAAEELPAGSMAFRLLPEVAAGDGEGGGGESPGSLPARVQIDFDDIPEQYRFLVKRYFAFLGGRETDRAGGTGQREGQRKE